MTGKIVIGLLVAACMVLPLCTTGVDGGGSEITNGKLVGMNGSPLAGRTVDAYPQMYVHRSSSAETVIRTVTEADGTFELPIDSGMYNLYFVDTATASGVCVRDIAAGQQLGVIRLDMLGAIRGTVRTTDTAKYRLPLRVFGKGVPLMLSIPSNDSSFSFESVPPGVYLLSLAKPPLAGCAPGEDCLPVDSGKPVLFSPVTVDRGKTAAIDTLVSIDDVGTLR